MIAHHPSEPTLAAYATGTLPQALAMVVATHLTRCGSCHEAVITLEATGGTLLGDLTPIPLAIEALDRLMARADEPGPLPPPILNPELPPPLDRVAMGRWWPIGRGVGFRPMIVNGAAWGGLVRAQPGRTLPRHGHEGRELTCILSGAFADAHGAYGAGDISEPPADHDQPPVVIGRLPCLCVTAFEGLRLRGVLGVVQRIIGR